MTDLFESISRLTAWERDYGGNSTDVFRDDLKRVLEAARRWLADQRADDLAADDLTDEEYGRRWAAENEIRTDWDTVKYHDLPMQLRAIVTFENHEDRGATVTLQSLGRAVREVHKQVPRLKEQL